MAYLLTYRVLLPPPLSTFIIYFTHVDYSRIHYSGRALEHGEFYIHPPTADASLGGEKQSLMDVGYSVVM